MTNNNAHLKNPLGVLSFLREIDGGYWIAGWIKSKTEVYTTKPYTTPFDAEMDAHKWREAKQG